MQLFSDGDHWDLDPDQQSPPCLKDALGILKCEVVSSIRLRDLAPTYNEGVRIGFEAKVDTKAIDGDGKETSSGASGGQMDSSQTQQGSELFICKVLEVQMGEEPGIGLLHHRQQYVLV